MCLAKKILILVVLKTTFFFSQYGIYEYSSGYRDGFKEACSCNKEIQLFADMRSYKQGFDAGYIDGRIYKSNNQSNNQDNRSTSPDFNLMYHALKANQDRYNAQVEMENQKRIEEEREEKEKTISRIRQVRNYYNSFKVFPIKIEDGWHKVWVVEGENFCEERKVFVKNNRIVKYLISDFLFRNVNETLPIVNGRVFGELIVSYNEVKSMEFFFLEDISNSNPVTYNVKDSGKITIFTDCDGAYSTDGETQFFVENRIVGKIGKYCYSYGDSPTCGRTSSQSAITIELVPGEYNYYIKNNRRSWSGKFTVRENDCQMIRLTNK